MAGTKLYIVEAEVLPEVYRKVCQAKELLQTGAAGTVAEAVEMVGISRSAFYKYRDAVRPFRDMRADQIVTLSVIMRDRPGALSSVLTIFAGSGANILTINQSIPVNGVGMVTISFISEEALSLDELRARLEASDAVVRIDILAG